MNASTSPASHPLPSSSPDELGLYRRIAAELPRGVVFVVDRSLRYLVAQGSELEAAGLSPRHFEGRTVREAVPPALADQHEADYLKVLDGGSFEREHELNGRHYRSYGTPLRDKAGVPVMALVLSYEVTDQVRAERAKDKALAIVGHELRNPLETLNMAMALLKRSPAAGAAPGTVELMERQVSQMGRMIDDLLGLAYLSHGKLQLRRERIDIAAVVDEVVANLRPAANRKALLLACERPEAALLVDADAGKLTQILTNLAGNAIKYTPERGTVRIAYRDQGDTIAVDIADTGVGFDEQALGRLFDLFARGVQHGVAPARFESGLGIGLWVARQLAEVHGGRLSASSPGPGAGSVFTLTLPKPAPEA